jgi:hypothetical protein
MIGHGKTNANFSIGIHSVDLQNSDFSVGPYCTKKGMYRWYIIVRQHPWNIGIISAIILRASKSVWLSSGPVYSLSLYYPKWPILRKRSTAPGQVALQPISKQIQAHLMWRRAENGTIHFSTVACQARSVSIAGYQSSPSLHLTEFRSNKLLPAMSDIRQNPNQNQRPKPTKL